MRSIRGSRTAFAMALGLAVAAASLLAACSGNGDSSRQEEVAQKGASVMPFDLNKTHHVFELNSSGGVETVRALDSQDSEQIALVRSHLEAESVKFAAGDFSDPMAIHGMIMPGVSALSAAGIRLRVKYAELADGASISYASDDPVLVAAIHDWFNAQVADHGQHATAN